MLKINSTKFSYLILFAIVGIHIFALSKLIFFPYPEFFIHPYLTAHGLIPYKQILDQHFPGLMFFPLNFATLGMQTAQAARIWSWGVVAIEHVLLFICARKLFKSNAKALFSNLLFLAWHPFFEGWVFWIDSILPVFLLAAFYFLISQPIKKKDIFWAGIFLGLASVFKQVVVPLSVLVALALFFRLKKKEDVIYFLLGYLPAPLLMVIYFWSLGAFGDFWYWTVIYNLTVFSKYGGQAATTSQLLRFVFVYGLSLVALVNAKLRKTTFWLFVFILGGLASVLARFDFVHLQPSLPFVAIASVAGVGFLLSKAKLRLVLPLYLLAAVYLLSVFYKSHIGNKTLFFDEGTLRIADKVRELTTPGEKIFVYAAPAHLYQLTETLPAGDVLVMHFPWFFRVTQRRILEGLIKDKPRVIVSDPKVIIQGQSIVESSSNIFAYLLENYQLTDKIGSTEILIRKEK